MLRGDRLTLAGVIALAILAGEARAQFGSGYYPGGYGGYGTGEVRGRSTGARFKGHCPRTWLLCHGRRRLKL